MDELVRGPQDESRDGAAGSVATNADVAAPAGAAGASAVEGSIGSSVTASGGRLFVVGTPIGNLGDLSPRAVEAFRAADAILCEDTRVTAKLLAHAGVSRPLLRCDENVIGARAPAFVDRMLAGEVLAFASDAGMPGVSDPGQVLVDASLDAGVPVEVVPGPSACVTALVASGIPCEHFFFEGFLPRRAGERKRRLERLAAVPGALIFYESPHRTQATLDAIASVFPERTVALCRELTKLHEEVLRAPAPELARQVLERGEVRGEVVLVVAPPGRQGAADAAGPADVAVDAGAASSDTAGFASGSGVANRAGPAAGADSAAGSAASPDARLRADIEVALATGEQPSAAAKRLSQKYSLRKRAVYDLILEVRGSASDDEAAPAD